MRKPIDGFDPRLTTLPKSLGPNRVVWAIQIFLAFAFGAAGAAKLIGVAPMVDLFDQIGFGQWFRYVTGGIEVGSALLLLSVRTAWVAGVFLACIMIGAVLVHIFVVPSPPIGPLVLGALATTITFKRRPFLS